MSEPLGGSNLRDPSQDFFDSVEVVLHFTRKTSTDEVEEKIVMLSFGNMIDALCAVASIAARAHGHPERETELQAQDGEVIRYVNKDFCCFKLYGKNKNNTVMQGSRKDESFSSIPFKNTTIH